VAKTSEVKWWRLALSGLLEDFKIFSWIPWAEACSLKSTINNQQLLLNINWVGK
jgi:hypothetical protein